jgi:hypothetical protein
MSRSRRSTITSLILAISIGAPSASCRIGNTQCREKMTYSHVRQVLLAAYPDLPMDLCQLRITFSTPINRPSEEFTSFDAAVTGPLYFHLMIVNGKHVSQVEWTTLLGASFAFDASWCLARGCTPANSTKSSEPSGRTPSGATSKQSIC